MPFDGSQYPTVMPKVTPRVKWCRGFIESIVYQHKDLHHWIIVAAVVVGVGVIIIHHRQEWHWNLQGKGHVSARPVITNLLAIDPHSTIKTARLELNSGRGGGGSGGDWVREQSSKKRHATISKISWESVVDGRRNVGDVERWNRRRIEMGVHGIKGSDFVTVFGKL